jgi:hypothetical protein
MEDGSEVNEPKAPLLDIAVDRPLLKRTKGATAKEIRDLLRAESQFEVLASDSEDDIDLMDSEDEIEDSELDEDLEDFLNDDVVDDMIYPNPYA